MKSFAKICIEDGCGRKFKSKAVNAKRCMPCRAKNKKLQSKNHKRRKLDLLRAPVEKRHHGILPSDVFEVVPIHNPKVRKVKASSMITYKKTG